MAATIYEVISIRAGLAIKRKQQSFTRDKRSGFLVIGEDGNRILHICWKGDNEAIYEEDVITERNTARFRVAGEKEGKVIVAVRFVESRRELFFWLEDEEDNPGTICKNLNAIIQNSSTVHSPGAPQLQTTAASAAASQHAADASQLPTAASQHAADASQLPTASKKKEKQLKSRVVKPGKRNPIPPQYRLLPKNDKGLKMLEAAENLDLPEVSMEEELAKVGEVRRRVDNLSNAQLFSLLDSCTLKETPSTESREQTSATTGSAITVQELQKALLQGQSVEVQKEDQPQ